MKCPFCNIDIDPVFYFCPGCGKKIREKPMAVSFWPVFLLFALCILLPPFNIGLTIKYMKSPDPTAKKIGVISLIVMIFTLVVALTSTYYLTKYVSDLFNIEIQKYQNLGY